MNDYNLTKAAYSVTEILDLIPIGRTSLYKAIKDEKLVATKFGKRTLFLTPHIINFLTDLDNCQICDGFIYEGDKQ